MTEDYTDVYHDGIGYADHTETFLQLLRVLHTNIRGHLLPSVAIRAESGLCGVLKT